ncbi:MAG TPA: dipeptide epimerase [Bacillota bacterium]|nr:dipeptide epimerase [Bacillota bacterium]HOK68211.1 dipeptide epimerase [Bacillota bacterium]HPP85470.1 dipeptide epimerase [Bacillota bacterium]
MKIIRVHLYEQYAQLKTPFKTALRTVDSLSSVIVEFATDEGLTGYGAASPTAAITGETMPSIICALKDYIKSAVLYQDLDLSLTEKIANAIACNASAKAAAEMALFDLLAQEKGVPLYKYLGGRQAKTLENDITISLNPPDVMAEDAAKAVRKGIRILKVKLGGAAEQDIRRIDAVAAVGGCVIRIDANQAWDFDTAVSVVNHCVEKNYDIQLIEQPFGRYELELMKKLKAASRIPILADESVFTARDAKAVASSQCADFINIKLAKSGGIAEAVRINRIAEKAGIKCLMGCMLENPIGVIAAAHFASAFDNVTMADLDAVELLQNNPIDSSTIFKPDKIIITNEKPGLGITDIWNVKRID